MKNKSFIRVLACVLSLLCVAAMLTACSNNGGKEDETTTNSSAVASGDHTKVRFDVTIDGSTTGSFTMELYPEYAPITVENFLSLVGSGFYDGLTIHRVSKGNPMKGNFVAQGGSTDGRGMSGSDPIKGEFAANGVENTLSHTRGVVSMARRSNDYDSGSSQFFICYSDNYTDVLDGQYAGFGKVIDGMDFVDSFLELEIVGDTPQVPIVITKAQVVA